MYRVREVRNLVYLYDYINKRQSLDIKINYRKIYLKNSILTSL